MAARTTKKDLESKIALLEKKLQKLTDSVDLQKTSPKPASVKPKGTLPKGTAPKPTPEYVKPKGTLPKTTASAVCTCTNKTQRHYAKRFHTRMHLCQRRLAQALVPKAYVFRLCRFWFRCLIHLHQTFWHSAFGFCLCRCRFWCRCCGFW